MKRVTSGLPTTRPESLLLLPERRFWIASVGPTILVLEASCGTVVFFSGDCHACIPWSRALDEESKDCRAIKPVVSVPSRP